LISIWRVSLFDPSPVSLRLRARVAGKGFFREYPEADSIDMAGNEKKLYEASILRAKSHLYHDLSLENAVSPGESGPSLVRWIVGGGCPS
jgi:hypothetical protein